MSEKIFQSTTKLFDYVTINSILSASNSKLTTNKNFGEIKISLKRTRVINKYIERGCNYSSKKAKHYYAKFDVQVAN